MCLSSLMSLREKLHMPQTKRDNVKTLKYKVLNFMLQIIHLLFIKNQKRERQMWPEVHNF